MPGPACLGYQSAGQLGRQARVADEFATPAILRGDRKSVSESAAGPSMCACEMLRRGGLGLGSWAARVARVGCAAAGRSAVVEHVCVVFLWYGSRQTRSLDGKRRNKDSRGERPPKVGRLTREAAGDETAGNYVVPSSHNLCKPGGPICQSYVPLCTYVPAHYRLHVSTVRWQGREQRLTLGRHKPARKRANFIRPWWQGRIRPRHRAHDSLAHFCACSQPAFPSQPSHTTVAAIVLCWSARDDVARPPSQPCSSPRAQRTRGPGLRRLRGAVLHDESCC